MAKKDATFRTDISGNPVISSNKEYYLNIATMLFNMIPGTDPYNPEMGLNISQLQFKPGTPGERDTAYENEIATQFGKYTDMLISTPIVQYVKADNAWKVTFQIVTNDATYNVLAGYEENTLSILIDG